MREPCQHLTLLALGHEQNDLTKPKVTFFLHLFSQRMQLSCFREGNVTATS
jgi:hypothetical protein